MLHAPLRAIYSVYRYVYLYVGCGEAKELLVGVWSFFVRQQMASSVFYGLSKQVQPSQYAIKKRWVER